MSPYILVKFGILYVTMVLIYFASPVVGDVWRTVTACYGADPSCSAYKLECRPGEKIVLGDLKYGTKNNTPGCLFGVSKCATQAKQCCTYDARDMFTDFGVENRTNIKKNCEGKVSCNGMAPRLFYHPYSSYVLIRYACAVGDRNVVNMCSGNKITGNEAFISYKKSTYDIANNTATTDCTCLVTQRYCRSYLDVMVVDLDFYRPGTSQPNCSNAYVESTAIGSTMRCLLPGTTQKYNVYGKGDMVSIHGLYKDDIQDRPNNIVIYYNSSQPFTVECFRPGSVINQINQCSTTIAPTTRTTRTSLRTTLSDRSTASRSSSVDIKPSDSTTYKTTKTRLDVSSTNSSVSSKHIQTSHSSPATKSISSEISTQSVSKTLVTHKTMSVPLSTSRTKYNATLTQEFSNQTTLSTVMFSVSRSSSTQPVSKSSVTSKTITVQQSTSSKELNAASSISRETSNQTYRTTISSISHPSSVKSHSNLSESSSTTNKNSAISSKPPSTTLPAPFSPSTVTITQNINITSSVRTQSQNLSSVTFSTTKAGLSTMPSRAIQTGSSIATQKLAVTSTVSLKHRSSFGTSTNATVTNVTAASNAVNTQPTRASRTTKAVVIDDNDDDGGDNKGLIIGLSVAAVLLVGIIALVVVMCFCFRLKRSEKERRNYIQNTNIFYSFPEDPDDDTSTGFESQHTALSKTGTLPLHYANPDFKRNGQTANTSNSTIRLDNYKIQASSVSDSNGNLVGVASSSSLVEGNGRGYSADMANETLDFVNGTEANNIYATINKDKTANGEKKVSFDQSAEKPEGRTKF